MMRQILPAVLLAFAALVAVAAMAADRPALRVVPWAPAGISSPQYESHAAFDPRNGDLYFVRSSPSFEGWRIFTSRCGSQGWTLPQPPAFAGDGVEADPYFAAGGNTLYFISTRSTDGIKRKDLDIWQVERDATGRWGVPQRLPQPINSAGNEWFPRPAPDGWLYFGSDRPGGLGKTDIWRARAASAGHWQVENLGPAINTVDDEYEPLSSPDGQTLIVMGADGLYESHRTGSATGNDTGWSTKIKLGPEVNATGTELAALFSPSGRSLMFARDTKGARSGEFFVWHIAGDETWPPVCPKPAP